MKLASEETHESLPDCSSENVCAQAARELTGVNDSPKAQESQVAGAYFFLQGSRAVRDEEGCHRHQEKSQHLLKPQKAPEHTATAQRDMASQ